MVEVEFEPRPLSHEAAWLTNTEIQHLKAHDGEIRSILNVLLRATFFECLHEKINCSVSVRDIELKIYTLMYHTCTYVCTEL